MFKYISCYFFVLEVELDRASTSRFVGEVSVSLYDVKGSITKHCVCKRQQLQMFLKVISTFLLMPPCWL